MPQKKKAEKEKAVQLRPVPRQNGQRRAYANFVQVQGSDIETQLLFLDIHQLSKEEAQSIAVKMDGLYEVPVVAKIVLPQQVAKRLGEILLEQAQRRADEQSKHKKP